jgi:hypothetical protein
LRKLSRVSELIGPYRGNGREPADGRAGMLGSGDGVQGVVGIPQPNRGQIHPPPGLILPGLTASSARSYGAG